MSKKTKQRLFNDGVKKECGKCHQIKSHNEFRKRQGRLRSICEECRNNLQLLKNFKKKLKIIIENFNGKCLSCKNDVTKLPTLEFHHPNPKSKSYSWRTLRVKNYEETLRLLRKDNVIVLCKNCHILIGSVNFKEFKKFILLPSLFLNTPDDLQNKINVLLNNNQLVTKKLKQDKYYKSRAKYIIKKWIKKRYIIEQLYSGKCIGCEEITVKNNLPSLGFHHILPSKKETVIKWDTISKFSLKKISYLLISEKCVCLCSNCHTILHSVSFIRNINEIFRDKYDLLINQVRVDYNKIIINIQNYDFENHLNDSLIREII
ncbi:MAG: hypothetical protein KAW51_00985 [Candidatus Lokiarchaeota archaeon]|nr:hypothetical protein [Candidatus Lokiarchaeota archaeon]